MILNLQWIVNCIISTKPLLSPTKSEPQVSYPVGDDNRLVVLELHSKFPHKVVAVGVAWM